MNNDSLDTPSESTIDDFLSRSPDDEVLYKFLNDGINELKRRGHAIIFYSVGPEDLCNVVFYAGSKVNYLYEVIYQVISLLGEIYVRLGLDNLTEEE